jgi:deazaflavin-dependent oxidoreductase (nitroreductase family)
MEEKTRLSTNVVQILAEHVALYRRDPEKAHWWDTAAIGLKTGVVQTLLLRTKGRKSGEDRYVTLQYFRPKGLYVVVGSKGGVAEHPVWFLNLLAEPRCHVQVGKLGFDAVARVAEGAERDALWPIVSEEQPNYKHYAKRTSRIIPVVILDPLR